MQQDKTVVTRVTQIFITFLILVSFTLVASADQTNDSDKYTFENYGGEVYTPEPMEFGANLNGTDSVILDNETERKHVYLQFYSIPNDTQRGILKNYSVIFVKSSGAYSYVFSMPAYYTAAELPDDAGLRWMGEIPVENKYEGLNVPDWARTEDGQVELEIRFYEDITHQEAENIANKYSSSTPELLYPITSDHLIVYGIITEESNITSIASEDIVETVYFPEPDSVPENDDMSDNHQSPGFQSIFSILIISTAFFYLRRESKND